MATVTIGSGTRTRPSRYLQDSRTLKIATISRQQESNDQQIDELTNSHTNYHTLLAMRLEALIWPLHSFITCCLLRLQASLVVHCRDRLFV